MSCLPNLGRLTLHPLSSTGAPPPSKRIADPPDAGQEPPAKKSKKLTAALRSAMMELWKKFKNENTEEVFELFLDQLEFLASGLVIRIGNRTDLDIGWLANDMGKASLDADSEVYQECLRLFREAIRRTKIKSSPNGLPMRKKAKSSTTDAQKAKQQNTIKVKQYTADRDADGAEYFEQYPRLPSTPHASPRLLSELKKKWPKDLRLQNRSGDGGRGCCAMRQDL